LGKVKNVKIRVSKKTKNLYKRLLKLWYPYNTFIISGPTKGSGTEEKSYAEK